MIYLQLSMLVMASIMAFAFTYALCMRNRLAVALVKCGKLLLIDHGVMEMKKQIAGVVGLVSLSVGSAMAAVPAAVTTAIGDAQTDGITIATAVLVAIVALFAFKLMRKAL